MRRIKESECEGLQGETQEQCAENKKKTCEAEIISNKYRNRKNYLRGQVQLKYLKLDSYLQEITAPFHYKHKSVNDIDTIYVHLLNSFDVITYVPETTALNNLRINETPSGSVGPLPLTCVSVY
jgi:hypothetical protein